MMMGASMTCVSVTVALPPVYGEPSTPTTFIFELLPLEQKLQGLPADNNRQEADSRVGVRPTSRYGASRRSVHQMI